MSLARALAWNTGVQLIGKAISTVLGVCVVALMMRQLQETGFGMYATANAYLQIFALILDLGLNVTLIALLGEHAGDTAYEKRCVSALFTLRIISAVLVLGVLAPSIVWFTSYPLQIKLAVIGLLGSFLFPSINQVAIGVQQRHLSMHMNAIGEIVGRIFLLTGLVLAGIFGWNLFAIAGLISLGSLAQFAINLTSAYRHGGFYWNWDMAFWKLALKRSWPVGVSILFNLLYFKADTLVLGWFRPQAEVGVYAAAYRVLELLISIPFMYAGILLPVLAKEWARGATESFSRLTSRSLDAMLLLIAPMIVCTMALGPRLLSIISGPNFASSGSVVRVLIIAVAAIFLNTVLSHAIVALDAQRRMIPAYAAVALLAVAGYVILIPSYGMWAAAWITVGSETAILVSSWAVLARHGSIIPSWRTGGAAMLAGLAMLFAFRIGEAWPLTLLLIFGIAVYTTVLALFGGFQKTFLREIFALRATPNTPPPSA